MIHIFPHKSSHTAHTAAKDLQRHLGYLDRETSTGLSCILPWTNMGMSALAL